MKRINELKAGSILSYVNLLIGCIIPLLYTPVMLDILGQEEYGLYSLSNSVISYLGLLNFGMGSAVIRYITRYRAEGRMEDVRRTMGLFLTIYSALAVLVCIGGAVLVCVSGTAFAKGLSAAEIERMKILLVIMTISTAISFPLGVFSSVTIVFERYLFNKLVCIGETVLLPVLNLVVLYAGRGAVGMALIGLLFQMFNGTVYGVFSVRKLGIYPVFRRMPFRILKELIVFCAFIFLSTIVDMLYWATDKVLIGAIVGSVAVAIYNVGGTFTSMLQSMAHAISGVFAPRVNMMVSRHEEIGQISELLIRIGRLQYLVVSFLLSGYIVFGQAFVRLWAGAEYADAYYVGLMTMIPLTVPLIQNIAFTTIVAQNKHRFRSIIYAVIAVVNVVSTYLVLPYYGILGAAACTAVAYILGQGIIMNIYYYKVTGLDIPGFWKNIGHMSIVPAVMIAASMVLLQNLKPIPSMLWLLADAVGYSILFAGLSWLISMNRYEKELFSGLVKKAVSIFKRVH